MVDGRVTGWMEVRAVLRTNAAVKNWQMDGMAVLYFDQGLGAAQAKRWSFYAFHIFCIKVMQNCSQISKGSHLHGILLK